jgi:hypothetical protein
MNSQILIDSIVRQTTVLLAQLATSGGLRAPLAHIANQVFADLAAEIESQGVSRKVAADMFGISLRSYQRKVQRLRESSTDRGRSLWEAIYDFVTQEGVVTRQQIIDRFPRDDEPQIRSVLRELVEAGLVFRTGTGADTMYRAATGEDLGVATRGRRGLDELVWAIIYREGPLTRERLTTLGHFDEEALTGALDRLGADGRIEDRDGRLASRRLVVDMSASVGFEAAVYDHFHAMTKTICSRLAGEPGYQQWVGGSTYTLDIIEGHPLRDEVLETLADFRRRCSDLRSRVNAHNDAHGNPEPAEQVVVYAGQCVIAQGEGPPAEGEDEAASRPGVDP